MVREVARVVAVDAFPVRVAVIVPALKFPLASRATTLLAKFASVASTAHVVATLPLKLLPVRYDPRVSALGVFAVTVMFAPPLNDTPFMLRGVAKVVAVDALPMKEDPVTEPVATIAPSILAVPLT